MNRPANRTGSGAALCALFVLAGVALAGLFSTDQVASRRDLLLFFLPFKTFLAESLRGGDVPLWNPFTFLGTPFLATLQGGVLYPPSGLLLLPFPAGFNAFLLFHYFIALGGCWALFRARGLGLVAASIGSLTFVLGGCLVSLLNVTNHLQSAAWAPLALCLWTRCLARSSPVAGAGLVAVLAMQILGGSPETVSMTVGVLFAWAMTRELPDVVRAGRAAAALSVAGLAAAGLTAFQVLPTAEVTLHSARSGAFTFEQTAFWSLEPVALMQLLFPHSVSLTSALERNTVGPLLESQVPWLASLYLGLAPLCLAVAGLVRGRERALWGGIAAAGVILALGKHGFLFAFLYDLVPGLLGKFRYPEKLWFLTHLAAAILAAEGTERLRAGDRAAFRVVVTAGLFFLAIGLGVLVIREIDPEILLHGLALLRESDLPSARFAELATDFVFKAQRLTLVLAAFLAVLALQRRGSLRGPLAGGLLVALVAADLGGAHHDLNLSVSWSRLSRRQPLVDVETLRRRHLRVFNYQTVSSPRWGTAGNEISGLEEGFRILRSTDDVRAYAEDEWPLLPGNTGIFHGIGTVMGSEAIDREEIEAFRDVLAVVPRERAVHLLGLYSTGALVGRVPLEVDSLRLTASDGARFAYALADPVPRAYLVSRLRKAPGRLEAFNELIAPSFQAGREAVVERLPPGWPGGPGDHEPGSVTIERYGADEVRLRAQAKGEAFLVLNDSWFPGWEARVDGRPVEILRTNALVRGIAVPPGDHRIRFRYRPLSLLLGTGISIGTGIIFLTWIVLRLRRPAGPRSR